MGGLLCYCFLLLSVGYIECNFPLLDVDTNMRIVLVPYDFPLGLPFYRLKASDSDRDFPLEFEVLGNVGKELLSIVTLGCSDSESLCEADVILKKALDAGRTYEFQLRVTDKKGDFTRVRAAISATESPTPVSNTLILKVREDTVVGTEVGKFIARKNELNSRTVFLEIRDNEGRVELRQRLISNNITQGSIILSKKLDYETVPWFTFTILTLNGYTNLSVDTRNVIVSEVIIGVENIQDTPPIFKILPNSIQLSSNLRKGDLVGTLLAEDGDGKDKRMIRYGILPDLNPFVSFFNLHPISGELRIKRDISDLVDQDQKEFNLSVIAEEIGSATEIQNPKLDRTVANITFYVTQSRTGGNEDSIPVFLQSKYVGEVTENPMIGSLIPLEGDTRILSGNSEYVHIRIVLFDGFGDNAVEIIPKDGIGNFSFQLRVKDPKLFDFEKNKLLKFKLAVTSSCGNSSADVEIYIRDDDDNVPMFTQKEYKTSIPENISPGTEILRVEATDRDGGVLYYSLSGSDAEGFHINTLTGVITKENRLLDHESQPEIRFHAEAKDTVHTSSVGILLKITDINDNPPIFMSSSYEAILLPSLDGFKRRVEIKAKDEDGHGPNSDIRYTVIGDNRFTIDPVTGEFRVKNPPINSQGSDLYIGAVKIRAYDLGNPSLSSETQVHIFSDDILRKDVEFLFPMSIDSIKRRKESIARMIGALYGGEANITQIRPYIPNSLSLSQIQEPRNLQYIKTAQTSENEKTLVRARVYSPINNKNEIVDLETIKRFMDATDGRETTTQPNTREVIRGDSSVLFWLLLSLILLLLILFFIFVCCIFCPCCWLSGHGRRRDETTRHKHATFQNQEIHPHDPYPLLQLERANQIREIERVRANQVLEYQEQARMRARANQMDTLEAEGRRGHQIQDMHHRLGNTPANEMQDWNTRFYNDERKFRTGERREFTRSPTHSLPPPHNNRQRFFKTDEGEVLQFDFDGDEGKELLMRRFIQEQKPSHHTSGHISALESQPRLPIDAGRPKGAPPIRRQYPAKTNQIHPEIYEEESPIEQGEDDIIPLHKIRSHHKEKDHRTKRSEKKNKSDSKSKDRSRSRESDTKVQKGDDGDHFRHHSRNEGKIRRSKSPEPKLILGDSYVAEESRGVIPTIVSSSSPKFQLHNTNNVNNMQIENLNIEEDEEDSGIGLIGRSRMMEKKSVFTIAYDEISAQNLLRPDTATQNT